MFNNLKYYFIDSLNTFQVFKVKRARGAEYRPHTFFYSVLKYMRAVAVHRQNNN